MKSIILGFIFIIIGFLMLIVANKNRTKLDYYSITMFMLAALTAIGIGMLLIMGIDLTLK